MRALPWYFVAQLLPGLLLGSLSWTAKLVSAGLVILVIWNLTRSRKETAGVLRLGPPAEGWAPAVRLLALPILVWGRLLAIPGALLLPQESMLPLVPGAIGPALAVTVGLLVPFQEELLYRGLLLRALEPLCRVPAMLLSSVLFGLGHGPGGFLGAAAMGWLLAWMTLEYRSIWPAVLIHALFNNLSTAAALAADSLVHGPIIVILAFGVLMIAGLVMTWLARGRLRQAFIGEWRGLGWRRDVWPGLRKGFGLWPVWAMAALSLLVWIMMFRTPMLPTDL